jgi:hypothetical protein
MQTCTHNEGEGSYYESWYVIKGLGQVWTRYASSYLESESVGMR